MKCIGLFSVIFLFLSTRILAIDPPVDSLGNASPEPPEHGVEVLDYLWYPAGDIYLDWNTRDCHPYDFDVLQFNDTVHFTLIDSFDCGFSMPVSGKINSDFGHRRYRYHYGIDIDLATGDTVQCVFDGVVRIAKYSSSYGNVVVVRHLNGLESLYAHLSKISVKEGQQIEAGDLIGLGGSTGRSSGSHLHFEIRYKGWPIDPKTVIAFKYEKLYENNFTLTPGHLAYLKELKSMKYIRVKSGDNLSLIARRNHTSVNQICKLNRISRNTTIYPGQQLRVR